MPTLDEELNHLLLLGNAACDSSSTIVPGYYALRQIVCYRVSVLNSGWENWMVEDLGCVLSWCVMAFTRDVILELKKCRLGLESFQTFRRQLFLLPSKFLGDGTLPLANIEHSYCDWLVPLGKTSCLKAFTAHLFPLPKTGDSRNVTRVGSFCNLLFMPKHRPTIQVVPIVLL